MAILSSLIVNGSGRILNKLYVNDLVVGGSSTFEGLTAKTITASTSLTSSGTLTVTGVSTLNGNVTVAAGKTLQLLNTTDAAATADNSTALIIGPRTGQHLSFDQNEIMAKATATTAGTLNLNIDGGTVYLGSQPSGGTRISANNGLLVAENINVANTLRATRYDLQSISQSGGSLYISPTIKLPNSSTKITVAKQSDNKLKLTIQDDSFTTNTFSGIAWTANSLVKCSGEINGIVSGTMNGTIESINTSNKQIVIKDVNGENYAAVATGTYDNTKIKNFSVMVYQLGNGKRIGMLLSCYDIINNSVAIRIYGGTYDYPNVMLGNLTNANLNDINGTTPTGWGLYAQNAFLEGTIVSTSGKIGGWSLGTNRLYSGTLGADNSTFISNANMGDANTTVSGQKGRTDWRVTAGSHLGITNNGTLYCNAVHITGEVTATSGTIGGCSITNNVLQVANANITSVNGSKITANSIKASKLVLTDSTNYITVNESNSASAITESHPFGAGGNDVVKDGYFSKATATNQYLALSGYTPNSFLENDELYYSISIKGASAGTATVRIWFYGTNSGTDNKTFVASITGPNISFTTSDAVYTGTIKITATAATAGYYAIGIQDDTATKVQIYCKNASMRMKSNAKLIVNGAITTDALAANAVTSAKIKAGEVKTDNLATNAVTAAKIKAGEVTADKLAASAVVISGRNLLVGTRTPVTVTLDTPSTTNNYQTQSTYYTWGKKTLVGLGSGISANDYATISFDWSTSDQTTYGTFRIELYGEKDSTNTDTYLAAFGNIPIVTTSASLKSGHVTVTAQLTATTIKTKRIVIRFDNCKFKCTISNMMFSMSNREVDWSPSPYEVGGFQIDPTSIHTANVDITSYANNSIALSHSDFKRTVAGAERTGLRFAIGSNFGVTGSGQLFCSSANISGAITATSGKIGNFNISTSANTDATNGHLYQYSLWTSHITATISNVKYNFESGLNATGTGTSDTTFYVRQHKDGSAWTTASDTGQWNWYVRRDGYMYARNGQISGWVFDGSKLYRYSGTTAGTASTQYGTEITGGTSQTAQILRAGSRAYNGSSFDSWTWNTYLRNDGYFYSKSGSIGGWSIGSNVLSTGTYGSDGSLFLSNANMASKAIGGRTGADWRFTVGSQFGITNTGALYCNNAYITGEISATSGKIADFEITGHGIKKGTPGETNSLYLGFQLYDHSQFVPDKITVLDTELEDAVFVVEDDFAITSVGKVYASSAEISGLKFIYNDNFKGLQAGAFSSLGMFFVASDKLTTYIRYDGLFCTGNKDAYIATGFSNNVPFFRINAPTEDTSKYYRDLCVDSDNNLFKRKTSTASSIRYKNVIRNISPSDVDKAYKVQPVWAKWKPEVLSKNDGNYDRELPMMIAEDWYKEFPEVVLYNNNGQIETYYDRFITVLHQQMLINQRNEIDNLKQRIKILEDQLNQQF